MQCDLWEAAESGLVLANVRAHSEPACVCSCARPVLDWHWPGSSPGAPALTRPGRLALSCQVSLRGRHLMFKSDNKYSQVHTDTLALGHTQHQMTENKIMNFLRHQSSLIFAHLSDVWGLRAVPWPGKRRVPLETRQSLSVPASQPQVKAALLQGTSAKRGHYYHTRSSGP